MIIAFPHSAGKGGPGSFQLRFENELKKQEWEIVYYGTIKRPDVIFVVGGTKSVIWLLKMKLKGIPIIYRLDGINWLHRKRKTSFMNFLMAEYRNWNNKLIHAFFADFIVYQSDFSKKWWQNSGIRQREDNVVICNGVDLDFFLPRARNSKKTKLVVLEGTIDYSPYAVELLCELRRLLPEILSLELYGTFENSFQLKQIDDRIQYFGSIPRGEVAKVLQNSIYLSLDINPACPNTVIEALASGAPVVGFDTGSLKELVPENSGRIVPYGGNPWNLDKPDYQGLAEAIVEITENYENYSRNARRTAEENYDINTIVDRYVKVIQKTIEKKK